MEKEVKKKKKMTLYVENHDTRQMTYSALGE